MAIAARRPVVWTGWRCVQVLPLRSATVMTASPRSSSPAASSRIAICSAPGHVKHGERPRALGAVKGWEGALATSKNLAEQSCHVGMGQVVFEHSAEAEEVDEH